ncbi:MULTISPECIES: class I SAM-dependent methyltransferase [unclassified Ruegeria]|uniref:class I SAM-dependent DNA methyltransferase n=1 Tax=unclassified Ruegeria TaxID=2625375 RepID=UPI001491B889|nr:MULTISPECIES: class I SAM-dependent methyltransferase [unclassified Ruegeria]NOD33429.1 methyltransferase domain-containing protein [Ruegeria sp. HKCCD7296]NOE41343.1 methyltransferase domain-containing protein [Ruegeria sp. HKCCD7319]
MSDKKPDLHSAYTLNSPDEHKRLYAEWAGDYDDSIAAREDYLLHTHTARAFVRAGGQGPVLDVGAGTGLCGAVLSGLGVGPIDATDMSTEMLDQAMRKDIYRDAIEADVTQGIPVPRENYSGVVSSGTFTHGHLGPEVFPALLRIARPGAQFAISINARHFEKLGFTDMLRQLEQGQIRNLTLPEVRIYGDLAAGPNKDDRAFVALFERV